MTSEEAYLKFLNKVNKNATNDNIAVDKGRFVQIYNESQNKFIEWILDKKNEDDIRKIQKLVVLEKKLKEEGKFKEHQSFKFPSDYFSFENAKSYASKDSCSNEKIFLFEVKHGNIEEVLQDKSNKPSFKYREAPYTIGGDAINIYVDGFKIDSVFCNYYRRPVQLDVEGYINVEGKSSKTINPELEDEIVDRILSICAKEFNVNNDDLQRFQFDKDRIISEA